MTHDLSFLGDVSEEDHLLSSEYTYNAFEYLKKYCSFSSVYEIGFNAGHSACMFLEHFPEVTVHSIDNCRHDYTESQSEIVKQKYGDRFSFEKLDSLNIQSDLNMDKYDLVFVDGDKNRVENDVSHSWKMNPKYIFVCNTNIRKVKDAWFRTYYDKSLNDTHDVFFHNKYEIWSPKDKKVLESMFTVQKRYDVK